MGHRDLLVTQNLYQPPGIHRSVHLTRSVRRAGGFVQVVLSVTGFWEGVVVSIALLYYRAHLMEYFIGLCTAGFPLR
jgi:hypothetical protein